MGWQLERTHSSSVLDRMNALRSEYRRQHGRDIQGGDHAFVMTREAFDSLVGEVAMLVGPAYFRGEDWCQGTDFYFGVRIFIASPASAASLPDGVRLIPEGEAVQWL